MHQRNSSRVHWMVFFGICVSQMHIASEKLVTASITAPTTTMENETVYPSLTLTISSAENTTLYVSTSASNKATESVVAYTTVDPRTTLGNETIYSPSTIATSSKVSSRSSPSAPETTQLTTAEYNISIAHETTTSFDEHMTSSVRESPSSTSSTPETTLPPEKTSNPEIISTPQITSTPEITLIPGTTSTPQTTSNPEATSTPEITSTSETTSTTQCTTSPTTTKKPKKDCVIYDPDCLDQLRQELINDEGYKDEIYLDTRGNPTFGIGHKITRNDPEFGKPLGTKVSKERIEEAFKCDVKAAIESCCQLFKDFLNLPKEVQLIILNMRFNLGHTGLAKFAKFRNAINRGDWKKAADEMVRSKWYNQVPDRASRLVERMRKVGKKTSSCVFFMIDADVLDQLRKELINDEGYKDEIYEDTTGNPTFGIGHKITKNDPEFGKPLGTKVSKERIEEAFKADVKAAIESCRKLFKDFQNLPKEVQLIILNMRFNLGHAGLAKFAKFRNAVNRGDWEKAADEMEHSEWYSQVNDRARRLVERMRNVGKKC